ncbi:MAG: integrase arm-type DNA-binding domain-containing protein [Desulfovibrionaceae bacterium]|nr:integrase arm-type DNA-binding domain-containing protein [Desulfovibrionaceae bacterium]
MKLTDTFLRGLKATGKAKKHPDGEGLYLFVSPTGGKLWRMDYRFDGKRKTLSLGAYPAVSLADVRARRQTAKAQLAQGVDPAAHKQAVKAAVRAEATNSFEVVAREWLNKYKESWIPRHGAKILSRLERDIFPIIGGKTVGSVTALELLAALRQIEARGANDTARRTLQNCGQIFRYAIATGRAERDTAADLRDALTPVRHVSFATITEPKAIGALLRDIDAYSGNLIVQAALRIAPYVFVRPGELRRAEWAEFDLAGAEWRIPAGRMKMRQVHIVPLARQVLGVLEDLRQYTGAGRFLFPSMRANTAPISDMTLLAGLRRLGYGKEDMTVHGFRSMASTLLNEQGYNRDWIERQLAHGERNSVRAAYNYAEYLPERRRMMQEFADYLDGLRAQAGPSCRTCGA